jgi:hypothetical protein
MNRKLFLTPIGGRIPEWATDTLRATRAFSGMDVVALSDFPDGNWQDIGPYRETADRLAKVVRIPHAQQVAILRWAVMRDYVRAHNITDPVCALDWDWPAYQPVFEHFERMGATDYELGWCVDKDNPGNGSTAPYLIVNLDLLDDFLRLAENVAGCRKDYNDMLLWAWIGETRRVCDISVEHEGAMFDHNLSLNRDTHVHDGKFKRIVWKDGKPHFVRLSDGGLVKAVSIHYWTCKDRISADVQRALRENAVHA